jgi:P4 family phage/plasmid primase-like protien
MASELPVAYDDEESAKRKAKLKKLKDAQNKCGGAFVLTLVNSFLPAFCCPFGSEDPHNYFNQNPDLYPLTNGVWKFSEKRLVPYERDHYFTFRIPIAYNPNADTTDIRKASLDWFGQSEAVVKFIQMFIGYCLTGHTSRQEFLIVWGTKAGNGKSLLWGIILPLLLGGKDMFYATITSDALSSERVGNNDQLYNLNGKRFAVLSEPRRARGSKIDNEVVKNLTGDAYFTAEAKFKNSITFRLLAKLAMLCNDMPDIKFDDKGTYRRVKVAEQNCEFLDPSDYKEADEELKTAKKILMKDDEFVKRLVENTEGLLLWALEGANRYIDNPRMEAPEEMNSAKKKAVNEVDVVGAWIRSNIRKLDELEEKERPENWKKAKLTFKELKQTMNAQNAHLGQNQHGFEKMFKQKLEAFGYEVKGREGKGEIYIAKVDYCPAPDADEE